MKNCCKQYLMWFNKAMTMRLCPLMRWDDSSSKHGCIILISVGSTIESSIQTPLKVAFNLQMLHLAFEKLSQTRLSVLLILYPVSAIYLWMLPSFSILFGMKLRGCLDVPWKLNSSILSFSWHLKAQIHLWN